MKHLKRPEGFLLEAGHVAESDSLSEIKSRLKAAAEKLEQAKKEYDDLFMRQNSRSNPSPR